MRCLLTILVLLWPVASTAAPESMRLVGEARLQVLFWSVYDSRLYTTDGDYEPGERPVRLEIQYLRDIDADDLVARTGVEWQEQGIEHPQMSRWLELLSGMWPDVRENDALVLVVDENDQSAFYRNGELLGVIQDPDFGTHFLDIWLSPATTRPELRLALLGYD